MNIELAEQYILNNARLLERHRFAALFRGGDPQRVVAALLPYRNDDGGFGQALEPDGRGPGSQPAAVQHAFAILDEVGAFGGELVTGTCDYLAAISAEDGGLPFVHPNMRGYASAPWWQVPERYEGNLIPTGHTTGLLHKHNVDHPWLAPATEYCWRTIENQTEFNTYETMSAVTFLDHVPDRSRAQEASARLGKIVRAQPMGAESDQSYTPWDFAPRPESIARQWFSDDEVESGLDALEASQKDDGSWPIRWPIWLAITGFEWGGMVTIEALRVLVNYGRVSA